MLLSIDFFSLLIKNSSDNVFNSNESRLKSFNFPHSASLYRPSTTNMSNNSIEHKLRNLQINLAQGRTQEQLAQAGIFFPNNNSSAPSQQQQQQQQPQNAFSNYIDSVHKALRFIKTRTTTTTNKRRFK